MHQICFGSAPNPIGSLQCSPDPLAGFKGAYFSRRTCRYWQQTHAMRGLVGSSGSPVFIVSPDTHADTVYVRLRCDVAACVFVGSLLMDCESCLTSRCRWFCSMTRKDHSINYWHSLRHPSNCKHNSAWILNWLSVDFYISQTSLCVLLKLTHIVVNKQSIKCCLISLQCFDVVGWVAGSASGL